METDLSRGQMKLDVCKPLDLEHSARIVEVAQAFVRRWGDYAPTEAAFRGDAYLRRRNVVGQRFWLHVVLASEDILNCPTA